MHGITTAVCTTHTTFVDLYKRLHQSMLTIRNDQPLCCFE